MGRLLISDCFAFTHAARLLRDVPEKPDALTFCTRLASRELPLLVAFCAWFAALNESRHQLFQTHHEAGVHGWHFASYYLISSTLRSKYAGEQLKMP